MKNNTKGKSNTTEYGCSDTIVVAIGNGFVEYSQTYRKFTLVLFDDDLSDRYILIRYTTTAINLSNVNIVSYINKNPLLYGVSNSLLSTSQAHEFSVAINDFP